MSEVLEEKVLSPSQRRKKALAFRKSLRKRIRTMKRYEGRMPPREMLEKRAGRVARKAVIRRKRLLSPELLSKYPAGLTIPQKMTLEKKLEKFKDLIKRIQPRILKLVIKQQKEKIAAKKSAKGDQ